MIYLNCDYNEGAHPSVMDALLMTNMEQTIGYGEDEYCEEARGIIKKLCKNNKLYVQFLVGGTQANKTIIDAALRPHQGVLSADTGHINVHETGAIEACGHKVLALPSKDGKINASQIEEAYFEHMDKGSREHEVQPKMVYISNPTEYGTLYSKEELEDISKVCHDHGLYLFMDGARLGYGLVCEENDLDLPTIAELCDVFYIGGTKVGALFGEAVVINNDNIKEDFRYLIKQYGGMLAKGRLLGIQFKALLEDGLYFDISKHAILMADAIRRTLDKKGYKYYIESPSNQIFVIIPNKDLEKLSEEFILSNEGKYDDNSTVVRVCTSWATKKEHVSAFIDAVNTL